MSDYEANPVAVMEALALGRKVVVADTSGLSELASEGLATAVPPNTSPRGARRRPRSGGGRSRAGGLRSADWDDCADELLGLYDEILSSAPMAD